MTTRLAIESPGLVHVSGPARCVPVERVHYRQPRYRWIDALVTLTVMVWLTATLALMVGELYAELPRPELPTAVANAPFTAMPPVDAGPARSARSGSASI